ncbi:peptidoglycan DD-metalloendopeptidase family protein [Ferrimonas pelagia]|uniref:Peptidoglycan DD-metalloendopeptidase family protein n=1 Tax=Ferrimonas pelagia TaxID=1177826 RepID=A0ABP9F617_9GAMM
MALKPTPKATLALSGISFAVAVALYWPESEPVTVPLITPEPIEIPRRAPVQAQVQSDPQIIDEAEQIATELALALQREAEEAEERARLEAEALAALPLTERPAQLEYSVNVGDTLSGIFSRFGINQRQMYQVLEADYAYLALDTLMPGNRLRFWVDEAANRLEQLEVEFDMAHRVVFSRHQESFEVEEIILEGDWLASSSEVAIHGSFSQAASRAGVRSAEVQQITDLFKDKLDFRRQLRAGDTVRVLRESQSIDGVATGKHRLLAVEFEGRNWLQSAYLHNDGSYYDEDGQSLARAFMRHPFSRDHRISSRFNPNRLHPVTGRVSPHNGTDYAAATGTPILAAGDGVVGRVEDHPIAGKYVVLEHGGQYRTRYLHMSRIDVRRGQSVTRGQQIGAVGATGRVTGAHLHYEFHINGRAVDSLNARIPMATAVADSDKQSFLAQVYQYQSQMTDLIAQSQARPEPEPDNSSYGE